jgi:hypothetical protein
MNRTATAPSLGTALLAMCLSLIGTASAAPSAGEVVKVVGRASAISPQGGLRRLDQGGPVNSGDVVVTAASSFVRMKLTDGGYIVLRPNTRFQIADYSFTDKPEESRSVFSLLKGGFRAVTGLIGRRNKAAVSYRTAVATIGIRGTDFEVIDCSDGCPDLGRPARPGLYFKVYQGAVDVGGQPFDQGQGGLMLPGQVPVTVDFADPENPLNSDPTPAADPDDC